MKKKLAVTIPIRNTGYLLEENIPKIMEAIKEYEQHINIYIFDNSDGDEINELYEEIKKKFTNIFIHKTKEFIDADSNFLRCYSIPQEQYIWLLGDGFFFDKKKIKIIMQNLEKYDYIVFKACREIKNPQETKEYINSKEFFIELGWHATLAGSTILSKELINYMLENNRYLRYLQSNFIQLGFLLEGNIKYSKGIYLKDNIIEGNRKKNSSSWHNRAFEVFGMGWINFIESLPNYYDEESKKIVIKKHGIDSGFFKMMNLLNLRQKKYISKIDYKKYKNIFNKISDTNIHVFKIICYMPIRIAKIKYLILFSLYRIKKAFVNPKLLAKYIRKKFKKN